MNAWTVVDDSDDAEHFAVTLSTEGLRRAANDNALMNSLRKTPTVHTAIVIGSGIGIVGCCVLMFIESIIRNS